METFPGANIAIIVRDAIELALSPSGVVHMSNDEGRLIQSHELMIGSIHMSKSAQQFDKG